MTKIQVNAEALDKWLREDEENLGKLLARLSIWTIDKMRRGKYVSSPNKAARTALLEVTGLTESVLFRPASLKKRAS